VIEKLIKNISSISEELQLIRKALEGDGKIMLRVGISGEPDSKKICEKKIILPRSYRDPQPGSMESLYIIPLA